MVELYKFYKIKSLPNFIEKQLDFFENILDSTKSFQQKIYPSDFNKIFNDNIGRFMQTLIGCDKIRLSELACLNFVKNNGESNHLNWHNENGIKNGLQNQVELKTNFDCIIWLRGEKDKGGDLKLINDLTGELLTCKFDPPGFIVITKDTLHSVDNYFGQKYRVSFNIDFDIYEQ